MAEKQVFDLIISLGGNCSVASQCIYRNIRKFSLPFDYSFMANEDPIKYFPEGLKDRFKNFLLKENIKELKGKERGDEREKYQYKDTYTGYRYIHLFGNDINVKGVYEKGFEVIQRRINRFYDSLAVSKKILVICATDFVYDPKYIYKVKDTFEEIYPDKEFIFYALMFRSDANREILNKNVHIIYSERAVNLYDFNATNYEWAFLDDIVLSQVLNKKEPKKFFELKKLKKGCGVYLFPFAKNTLCRFKCYILGLRFDICFGKVKE